MNRSRVVTKENGSEVRSHIIKAIETGLEALRGYEEIPGGMFGSKAVIKCGSIILNSDELDFEFTVPFDDDLEPNEADITIYNLSDNTVNSLKKDEEITIEAGYGEDRGIIFKGYIKEAKTGYEDVDRVTELTCVNCKGDESIESKTYSENTKASVILKELLEKLNMPIAVFSPRRDWTYTDSVSVEGNLRELIRSYAEVCGISVYANNGSIYARYIKDGDNINFTVNEDTGLIGSPESYTEEINAEDYVDTISGYKVEMLLQHRITTAAIINLKSRQVQGVFRVRKGEHHYSDGEATTSFEAVGEVTSRIEEDSSKTGSKSTKKATVSDTEKNKIKKLASELIGTPYVWGGYSTSGFDCSGYVSWVMINSGVDTKVKYRMTAEELYNLSTKVSEPERGDIVYFDNGQYKHIGIYYGYGKMWHCADGEGVKVGPVSEGGNLVGYGRLIN